MGSPLSAHASPRSQGRSIPLASIEAKPQSRRRRNAPAARRVVFIGDLARFEVVGGRCVNDQFRNVEWLRCLFTACEWRGSSGLQIENLHPRPGAYSLSEAVDDPYLAQRYCLEPHRAWASQFGGDELSVFRRLLESAANADLVIGFELPPALKRVLNRKGVRYVSFSIHPIRMLRDLCFGATTNDARIADALAITEVSSAEIANDVRRLRAMVLYKAAAIHALPKETPVLLGQTANDSILIERGRFAEWSDFEEVLSSELSPSRTIAFLEHPSSPGNAATCEYLRSRIGKTVVRVRGNAYAMLLANSSIGPIYTLCSSLGVEAQLFGKEVTFLVDDPRRKQTVPEADVAYVGPLGHGCLASDLWQAILRNSETSSESISARPSSFALGDSYLRETLWPWAYDQVRSGFHGATVSKIIMPSPDVTDHELASLDSALRSCAVSSVPQARGDLDVVSMPRPIRDGEQRSVGPRDIEFEALLLEGFHAIESWGCWTSGHEARLRFACSRAERDAPRSLRISLDVVCFEGVLSRCPVLSVYLKERLLGIALFRPGNSGSALLTLEVPVDGGGAELQCRFTDLGSPDGSDSGRRLLGWGLLRVMVTASASEARARSCVAVCGMPGQSWADDPLLIQELEAT
jgi:hypothetical protein